MKQQRKDLSHLSRIAGYALAGLVLAIIALLLFVPAPRDNPLPGQPPAESPATQPTADPGRDTSAMYRPLPSLEGLIASARQRPEFHALSPAETVPRGTLVVFRWADEEKGPWKVTVLDNRGIPVREEEVKDPDFTLSSPKPGLYYWMVARADRLLHIGRVAVR